MLSLPTTASEIDQFLREFVLHLTVQVLHAERKGKFRNEVSIKSWKNARDTAHKCIEALGFPLGSYDSFFEQAEEILRKEELEAQNTPEAVTVLDPFVAKPVGVA